jgi:two-component system sensor histidine kinase KdpD
MRERRPGQHPEHLGVEGAQAHGVREVLDRHVGLAAKRSQPPAEKPRSSQVGIKHQRPVDECDAAIEVADRGPGIPEGSEDVLFEKFRRGEGAAARGSGLGLAICRGIVEAHGGTIRAARRAGGGAVFTVLLPRSDDTPDAATGAEDVAT